MWYKNVAGRFFGLVTKHACDRRTDGRTDGQTDRITTPKTALAQLRRAVKIILTAEIILFHFRRGSMLIQNTKFLSSNFILTWNYGFIRTGLVTVT